MAVKESGLDYLFKTIYSQYLAKINLIEISNTSGLKCSQTIIENNLLSEWYQTILIIVNGFISYNSTQYLGRLKV